MIQSDLKYSLKEDPQMYRQSTLDDKVSHMEDFQRERVLWLLNFSSITAKSLYDLHPADFQVKHSFEFTHEYPIYSRGCLLVPRDTQVVREELEKILVAEIITPVLSAWSFPVAIVSKNE